VARKAKDTADDLEAGQEGDLAVDTPETREAAAAGRPTARNVEEAHEVGYLGSPVDPEPNETYTVAGQVAAMPPASSIRNAPGEQGIVAEPMTVQEAGAAQEPDAPAR
jgi:hypothetical protein